MGSFIAPSSKRSWIVDADPNHPRRTYPQFTNIIQPVSTVERESPVNKLNRVVTSGLLYPFCFFTADPIAVGEYQYEACMNLATIQRLQKKMQEAEDLYSKARAAAASIRDLDKETLAKVHLAICLLDRGELKQATETYFKPLLPHKNDWDKYTRAIYLQSYGNACRSAADWGNAKAYLREALELANELKNRGLVSSCCGDLGNVFRSEGRYGFSRVKRRYFPAGLFKIESSFEVYHDLQSSLFRCNLRTEFAL